MKRVKSEIHREKTIERLRKQGWVIGKIENLVKGQKGSGMSFFYNHIKINKEDRNG